MLHSFAVTYLILAQMSINALLPSGKLPTTRLRCLNFKAGKSFQPLESEANFPLLQSSSRFSTSSTEAAV